MRWKPAIPGFVLSLECHPHRSASLREHIEDLPSWCDFLKAFNKRQPRHVEDFSPRRLKLENVIRGRAMCVELENLVEHDDSGGGSRGGNRRSPERFSSQAASVFPCGDTESVGSEAVGWRRPVRVSGGLLCRRLGQSHGAAPPHFRNAFQCAFFSTDFAGFSPWGGVSFPISRSCLSGDSRSGRGDGRGTVFDEHGAPFFSLPSSKWDWRGRGIPDFCPFCRFGSVRSAGVFGHRFRFFPGGFGGSGG